MFQTKVMGKIKTNILYSVTFHNHAVNDFTWENTVQPDMPKMTIWRMRNAYWKTKVTLHVHCLSCYLHKLT